MAQPILKLMRKYASEQGVTFERVGVYRFEEDAEHFKQEEWNKLKKNPTFKQTEAYIDSLGGSYTIGLYVIPDDKPTA